PECSWHRYGPGARDPLCGRGGGGLLSFRKACGICQDLEGGWPRSVAPRARKHLAGEKHRDSRAEHALQFPRWKNPWSRGVRDAGEPWRSKLHRQLSILSRERLSFEPLRAILQLYQVIMNCQ